MPLYDFGCPNGHRFERTCRMAECDQETPCEEPGCTAAATQIIAHSNPGGSLSHGAASNRDAALEGRYDPLNPNRRFMKKGRSWQR